MKPRVTLIDLEISNIHSVANAFRSVGANVSIAQHGREIDDADRIVLPGVGAFREGVSRLEERGFVTTLRRHAREGTPLLGICLGMQLLFTDGSEFGPSQGLDLLKGHVRAIPRPALRRSPVKLPHVGWDTVTVQSAHPLFDDVDHSFHAYFLHSFRAEPTNTRDSLATCTYGPHDICAVAGRGSVLGTQFHPEKSGAVGLKLLRNFAELAQSDYASREPLPVIPDLSDDVSFMQHISQRRPWQHKTRKR